MRALVIAALCCASPALADDEIVKGAVVKIEAKEIYVSLGSAAGVRDGAALRIKRSISLRHPITRAAVDDWLPIGSATVTQAGAVMSRAVIGVLVDQVRIGDVVEVLVDRPDANATPTQPQPDRPGPKPLPIDPATAEVLGVFTSQIGQPIEVRIAGWEKFLSMRPGSPYANGIRQDLGALHQLREQLRPPTAAQAAAVGGALAHVAPTKSQPHEAIAVVFVLEQPERVASAYLHYRVRGNHTYQRALLARENEIYLRGSLPADQVKAPGIDYFVEVSAPDGRSGLALGAPESPIAVEVAEPTIIDRFGGDSGRSSVKLAFDYLSFATFDRRPGNHRDRLAQANVDFLYRLEGTIQSIGVGYGVYSGDGGFADRAWTDVDPVPRTGFHYGYADIEIGGVYDGLRLSGGGALIAGVSKQGFGMGAEGRVRIGPRDGTNLALSARSVEEVGFVSDIRFGARPAKSFLLGVSVGATNQPNNGDVGVKLGTELEVIAIRNVSLLLHGSWQGRSIDHGGVGGGGGLGAYW